MLTDHHQIPNAGAVFVKNTKHALERMIPMWIELLRRAVWTFNDNGALMEVIAQYYVPFYKPRLCPTRPMSKMAPCYADTFYQAFGPVNRHGSRGRSGLKLVAPADGFNNHGCLVPVVECDSYAARRLMNSRYRHGWRIDDTYSLPQTRHAKGLPPMFALHSKQPRDRLFVAHSDRRY